ncbi:MAG: prepilin-type N-terminal cleavage/methylation domain-containing protein [Proteobacteria bacterium]|nr:MAG: prepilin-type N-terminal cleavage/methylation domain-containing protein [Pseudomonadota bacterium]
MKASFRKSGHVGFSLIETMVASAVVAIAAYYIVDAITNTLNQSMFLNDRLLANQIVQERISKMKNLAGYYVPVTDGNDAEGYYAGCFNKRGVAVKTDDGLVGESLIFGKKAGEPSGACSKSEVEVQFQADRSDSAILRTYIIVRQPDKKNFSTSKREIRLEKVL